MSLGKRKFWKFIQHTDSSSVDAWEQCEDDLPNELEEDQVLLTVLLVSVDPYLKIQQSKQSTWTDPYETDKIQLSYALAIVAKTNSKALKVGDYVSSYVGWCDKAVEYASNLTKIDYKPNGDIPLEAYLGPLGMTGKTAFYGIEKALTPITVDEVALVTGACGAVGTIVCQLLKQRGCFVIGVAGSEEKCNLLTTDFKCDVAINYKQTPITAELLKSKSPTGLIDVFFDNVGGTIFDAAIQIINTNARICICGQISSYDELDQPSMGPRFLHRLIYTRAKIQGVLARDCPKETAQRHQHEFKEMLRDNQLNFKTFIVEGFENIPSAQIQMMQGANIGKAMVKLQDY